MRPKAEGAGALPAKLFFAESAYFQRSRRFRGCWGVVGDAGCLSRGADPACTACIVFYRCVLSVCSPGRSRSLIEELPLEGIRWHQGFIFWSMDTLISFPLQSKGVRLQIVFSLREYFSFYHAGAFLFPGHPAHSRRLYRDACRLCCTHGLLLLHQPRQVLHHHRLPCRALGAQVF